jgi:aspartate aminotransferase-like enzyme
LPKNLMRRELKVWMTLPLLSLISISESHEERIERSSQCIQTPRQRIRNLMRRELKETLSLYFSLSLYLNLMRRELKA